MNIIDQVLARDKGLKFEGKNFKTENGVDYRYYLVEDEPSN